MASVNDGKALKSGIWYIVCNFVAKGAVFLSTPFFTRLMTTDDIGAFSNISAWVSILMIVTSLELATSITFSKYRYAEELDQYVSSVLALSTIVTVITYIIVVAFHGFFTELFSVNFLTLNIMFLYCIVSPSLQMIQIKNRILFRYKSSSILTLLSVFLSVFISLWLVTTTNDKLTGRLIGYYGSLIVFNLVLFIYIFIKGKNISWKYWKFALSISLPMIIHLLSGQLLSSCDRIMITKMCGASQNALYSIAYTAATVISVLWTSLNTAWSPWAYDQMDTKAYSRLKKASIPYVAVFLFIVVGFILLAPEIMLVMGGRAYLDAINVIPPVVIGMFFQYVYSLYVNIEFFHKKQKYTAMGTTIAAVLNVLLNWLLIPQFGYVAAAYTTLIGYIALFIIHFYIVYRMKKTHWYSTKFNAGVLLFSIVLVPAATVLYSASIVRWIIIGLMIFSVFFIWAKYRAEFKEAIKVRSFAPLMNKIICK